MGNNNIDSKDFLIGSLIGGIVGASVALLLAPKSGKDLRNDLNEQATVVKDKTTQLTTNAIEKGNEFANAAREKSKELTEQTTGFIEKVKEKNEMEEVEDDSSQQEAAVTNEATDETITQASDHNETEEKERIGE